ncbi:uncharacterized protein [Primulina eburnea]|uniref:uncharacterized protein isoform X3 n=1 Tax=Primulina eburnea TaxID=1245227 RepID=UPI003C6CA37B
MDSDRCFIGYRRMEVEELSLPKMRQMCDVYVRTLYPGSFGGSNTYLADEFLHVFRHIPQIALDAFNSAKGRNFKFVKFIKLNRISILFNSMTFEAKEDGSDECLLFRAVVNMIGTDNVLLCEIRDGDESKDLGDDILSFVRPSGHYICGMTTQRISIFSKWKEACMIGAVGYVVLKDNIYYSDSHPSQPAMKVITRHQYYHI